MPMVAVYAVAAAQGIITTYAGTDWIFHGDGKPALSAVFGDLSGIAVDPNGDPVMVDADSNVVVRLNPDGTLSVIAGNAFAFDSGDGGPARSAALSSAHSAAFDNQGNLYIGTVSSIRKISPNGIISTVAGNAAQTVGFSGDGGPAVNAEVTDVAALTTDAASNIYFVDWYNNRVRKIDTNGIITTVAGNGNVGYSGDGGPATAASLNYPLGVAVSGNGNLLIADTFNSRVRQVTPAGIISTLFVRRGGVPSSLSVDDSGVLYIGDLNNVYKLPPGATVPQLFAGSPSGASGFGGDGGPAIDALLGGITGIKVAADSQGNVYLADELNYRVRKVIPNGTINTVAGAGLLPADNVPALEFPFSYTDGIATDGGGNVFISESGNNRVLRISSGGVVSVFAGTGVAGNAGDNGPPNSAQFNLPLGLAFYNGSLYIADAMNSSIRKVTAGIISTYSAVRGPVALTFDLSGNLYVACVDQRVRKIDTLRNVTVIAGTGGYGSSGDGGPALAATFKTLKGVAVDTTGNVYVSDYDDSRVRVITPDGIIHPYAGTGVAGSSGDNGPATQAELNSQEGLALDTNGNLYIADASNALVRVVSPSGTISTFAGSALTPNDLGDGLLASQAELTYPEVLAFDLSGNLFIGDSGSYRVREVLAATPSMSVTPTNLSFTAPSGGALVTQTIAITSAVSGLTFRETVLMGANWLTADAAGNSTPLLVTVTADPGNLAPGTYMGVIQILPNNALPAQLLVNVTFVVTAAQPPSLHIDKPEISFTLPVTGSARTSTLVIANNGGQTLSYTATPTTASGGNWLLVSPASGSATPGKPSTLSVTANPAGLSPGTYTGQIYVQSNAGNQVVPVILTVSANSQAVLLTQTGLSFTAVAKGGVVPPQFFGVVNAGIGVMRWTASTSTTDGGSWLLASPGSGASDTSAAAPQVTVSVNASGLAQGNYYGTVRISAPGTANQSRVVTIFLQVLAEGTPYAAAVEPPELVFYLPPSGFPSSQVVNVYNIAATPRSFVAGNRVLPKTGVLDPNQPTEVVLQPNSPPGVVTREVTFQFSDGSVQSVKFTTIGLASSTAQPGLQARDQPACTPSQLVVKLNSLGRAFQVSAGWPVGLSVTVTDDCQNPVVSGSGSGSVWAHFDDGENDVVLTSLGDGTWQGTWKPLTVNPNITMTLNARRGSLSAQRPISGSLSSANDQPLFTLSSIGSAFPAPVPQIQPLAPGSFLSIYGQRLADYSADSAKGALPTQLGNTTVFFNDLPGAISHADPGQINVVVPYRVNLHTSNQIRVQRDLALSDPVAVDIADAQPSVLQVNGSVVATDYPAGSLAPFQVGTAAPAKAGDTLVMYCVGLGVTVQTIADGTISPASPPADVPGVTVSIGGKTAAIQFAGLAPGFVGLYQINAVMPQGVAAGAAQLSVGAGGQTSPALILAVQ